TADAPLMVKFPVGQGNVLFTSFHNEKQNSTDELKLLKYLVLSTVMAGVESRVSRSMISGGFSPQRKTLLSAKPGDPSVTPTYDPARAGALQFTLGFEARGASLRLEVVSPRGERFVKQGTSTLAIDVADAAAGRWRYTAVAEHLPYPDFPFTLAVGAVMVDDARQKTAAAASTPALA